MVNVYSKAFQKDFGNSHKPLTLIRPPVVKKKTTLTGKIKI
jgi:hypothetical protein